MELVEGDDLSQRIARGAIPLDEALPIAKQIAEALEAAHEQGIIHRDLKPANIKIRADGTVKVLDFGLAKIADPLATPESRATAAVLTQEGTVVGTAAYMSPEQARGQSLDKRTDIWSFGCVLFEMLAGRAPYQAQTRTDTLAAILTSDPDWAALAADVPPAVRRLLRRCLEKDPRRRLHDIADARLDLEDVRAGVLETAPGSADQMTAGASRGAAIAVAASLVVALGALVVMWTRARAPQTERPAIVKFAIAPALGEVPAATWLAISSAGDRVAYVGSTNRVAHLFVRSLTDLKPTRLDGTEGAVAPFFSPDGLWVAFFAGGKLKRVPVAGGPPEVVCDAVPSARGGAWGPDDTIVFTPNPDTPLMRVSAKGGTPVVVTHFAEKEFSHRQPQFLPGGKAIVYAAGPSGSVISWSEAHIVVQSLETGARSIIIPRGSAPRYVEPGYLVYLQGGKPQAIRFDPTMLRTAGVPVPLDDQVVVGGDGSGGFDVARSGTLVFAPGHGLPSALLGWIDRQGGWESLDVSVPPLSHPRVSPDGTRVAYTGAQPDTEIWVYDLARRTARPVTSGGGNRWSIWWPDGKRLAFISLRRGPMFAFSKTVDDTSADELLADAGFPAAWTPDGRSLVTWITRPGDLGNLHALSVSDRTLSPFGDPSSFETDPAFSPDGRWLAWASNVSGRLEVYVRAYPGAGPRWQISTDGGREPRWSPNGDELFFRAGNAMMAVTLRRPADFTAVVAHRLFVADWWAGGGNFPNYDVARDAQSFLAVRLTEQPLPPEVDVVLNWRQVLEDRFRGQSGR